MVVSAITAAGPIIGGLGFYFGLPVAFWAGVLIAVANLVLNLASGVMRAPILPALCILVGASLLPPWYAGAAVGLLAWTAAESAGEIALGIARMLKRG